MLPRPVQMTAIGLSGAGEISLEKGNFIFYYNGAFKNSR